MKLINKIYVAVLAVSVAAIVTGCVKKGPEHTPALFENKTTEGFYNGGVALYAFSKSKDQMYFNKGTNTFRIMTDDGMKYAEVVLESSIPGVGGTVTGTVSNHGLGQVKNYDSLQFEVIKKTEEQVWLWDGKVGLGVLMFYVP